MLGGKRVEVIDQYSGIWFYKDESGATGKALDYLFTEAQGQQPFVNKVEEVLAGANPPVVLFDEKPLEEKDILRINTATKTEIAALKGRIGRLAASRIYERRPEGGYESWEHVKEVNGDLSVDWDAVALDESIVINFDK